MYIICLHAIQQVRHLARTRRGNGEIAEFAAAELDKVSYKSQRHITLEGIKERLLGVFDLSSHGTRGLLIEVQSTQGWLLLLHSVINPKVSRVDAINGRAHVCQRRRFVPRVKSLTAMIEDVLRNRHQRWKGPMLLFESNSDAVIRELHFFEAGGVQVPGAGV